MVENNLFNYTLNILLSHLYICIYLIPRIYLNIIDQLLSYIADDFRIYICHRKINILFFL